MRFNRITCFFTLCILVWGTVTYFAFLNRPLSTKSDSNAVEFEERILKLQKSVKEQFFRNREIVDGLNVVIKAKKQDLKASKVVDVVEPVRSEFKGTVIPVLVFACNRVSVGRCLDKLIEYRPNSDQFPIIVSQVYL